MGRVQSFRQRECARPRAGRRDTAQSLVSNKYSFGLAANGAELSCDPRAEAELEPPELQDLGLGGHELAVSTRAIQSGDLGPRRVMYT